MLHSVNTKIVAVFITVFAFMLTLTFVVYYAQTREYEHELSNSMGLAAAEDCAALVELAYDEGSGGDFVPGSRDYEYCLVLLRELCQSNGMNYLYVCKYDVERNSITYIMAVGASDEENEAVTNARPYGMVIHDDIADEEKRALAGEKVPTAVETNNQFGHMLDWYYQIDEMGDNVLAGASYAIDQQRKRELTAAFKTIVPFFAAILMLLVIEVAILRKSVFKPLRVIADRMRGFSAEDSSLFEPLGITSKDEIGYIAESFEKMAGDIEGYVSRIERMAAERAQADYELEMSRRIQQGMVPERTETADVGFSACGFCRPARSVGGDFYDVVKLGDGRIAIVVGDASGKGMAAALFMSVAKTLIRDGLLSGFGPASVLSHTNERIETTNPEGMFVTVFACILDPATGEVRYANAGHMPPLLVGDDVGVLEVDPGELLGVFDDIAIEEASIVLEPGQGLLIYTDGVVEARAADNSFFGEQRFGDAMDAQVPFTSAGYMVDTVVRVVDEFAEGHEQFDDLTVAALMFDGVDGGEDPDVSKVLTSCELPCDMISFSKLREVLLAANVDDALKRKACLACEEAFVNIVSYSNATRIWTEVSEAPGRLCVTLADDGVPFDPLAIGPKDKDFEDLDSGGMGIGLIRQLASRLEYERDGDRNVLTVVIS